MTRVLISMALLISVNAVLIAQSPRNILLKTDPTAESVLTCIPGQENFAGTVSLGPFTGLSNDIDLDTMFLCFGDQVLIDHDAGSESLLGDPVPATTPGVGYAFYDCPPTISGDELDDIVTDPCLSTNPPPVNGIYIATGGTTSGDVLFENTGFLQDFFNAGAPLMLHFAPITYDDLVDSIAVFEGNPAGPCVNANTDEAFAVVYLNEIEISNINTSVGGNACTGSFEINGGLPEFDNSFYDVEIALVSDPSVEGFKQGAPPTHGSAQEFKVFLPGLYEITVSDNKGCQTTFQMNMGGCETISMDISEEFGEEGENVCVSVTASDFVDIQSFQFTLNFDNTLLAYTGNQNQNTLLTENGVSPVSFGPVDPNANGLITCNWLDINFDGQTIPDGTVLFEICFDLLGMVGDVANLSFDYSINAPTPIEVKRLVAPFDFEDLGLNGDDGSITIIDPQNITVALDTQDVSCNGGDDGAFTLTVTGGTAPYIFVYAKSGGGGLMGPDTIFMDGGSFTVSNLDAGLYIITTGDQSVPQTISTDSVLISEPPIPLGVGPDIAGGFTEPLCFGDSTGAFPVKVSGGTAPYSFLWNTGDTVEDLIGIPAGFYQITVTDDNGCTAIAGATLSNPAQLLTTTGGIDASCSGSDDGAAFVSAIGGTLNTTNYSYLWSNVPPSAADTVNNLDVGQYFVTVTDDNGCMAVDSVTIGAATIIQANALISQISCFGANDGSIDLNPSAIGIDNGGYFFNWTPLVAGPNDDLVDDLGPGNYAFTITDAVGCNIDSVVTITEPDLLEVTLVGTTNESCGAGNDGSITVSASGGTLAAGSDYTFDWGAAGQGSMITGLSAGDYTVTVIDDNGCVDSLTATILPPDAPDIISFDITDVPCATSTSGAITVNAVPGGAPITSIDWSNGDSGATITNLAPGPYIVTVTAQDGCEAVDTAVVDAPLPLISTDTLLTAPLCAGQCNGAISVAISGGTQPYSYSWSNGGNTNPIFGLCAGAYTVTVTDANFCPPLVLELELVDPAPLVAEVDPASIAGVSCFNGIPCDGQAAATATGGGAGTGDYVFQWSSGTVEMGTGSSVTNLCQDQQTVIVSDANNCLDTAFFLIPSPPPVELDPDNTIIEPVSCNGDTDGSATVAGTGGSPDPVNGYTYFWPFNNSTSPAVTNLAPGLYQVQITDGNGCQVLADIEIGEPDALDINSDSLIHVSCFEGMDGKLSVSTEGGNPGPVTYQWSDNIGSGATVSNLSAGPYTVTATDSRGCTATATFIINEPPPLFIEFDSLPSVRCFGETVTLSIDTVGGGSGQSYQVYGEDPIRGNIIYPLENLLERVPGGPGVVIVEDENGCILETNVFIDEPPPVEVAIEAAGFFGQDEVEIELGDSLELELNLVQVFLPIDSIQWSPLEDIRSFPNGDLFTVLVKPLDDMEYTVQVTDEDGCIGIDVIEIIVDKNRNVYVPNIFSPNGDGRNDFFEISIGPGVEIVNFMQVYDRWGELIFEAGDFLPELNNTVKWDGTFNGKMMNPGAYVYLIEVEFVDGTTLLYRGTVTLVR